MSPTWITTAPYPGTFYGDLFYQLVKEFSWTNIFVVTDTSSVPVIFYTAEIAANFMVKSGLHVDRLTYTKATFDANNILKWFRPVSRGMCCATSAPARTR